MEPHRLERLRRAIAFAFSAVCCLLPASVFGQAKVVADGQWRYSLGLGGSHSSGNTSATSVTWIRLVTIRGRPGRWARSA